MKHQMYCSTHMWLQETIAHFLLSSVLRLKRLIYHGRNFRYFEKYVIMVFTFASM
jgi:hypothetical protein